MENYTDSLRIRPHGEPSKHNLATLILMNSREMRNNFDLSLPEFLLLIFVNGAQRSWGVHAPLTSAAAMSIARCIRALECSRGTYIIASNLLRVTRITCNSSPNNWIARAHPPLIHSKHTGFAASSFVNNASCPVQQLCMCIYSSLGCQSPLIEPSASALNFHPLFTIIYK